MTIAASDRWWRANQLYLMGVLAEVRRSLEHRAGGEFADSADDTYPADPDPAEVASARHDMISTLGRPPALDQLTDLLQLSPFERSVLLLCAGMELDSRFSSLCAAAMGEPAVARPTFALALAVLPDPDWGALLPNSALRRWRLVQVSDEGGLTRGQLRIDERVLHYLTGFVGLDESVAAVLTPVVTQPCLVDSHAALVQQLVRALHQATDTTAPPVLELCGDDMAAKRSVAAGVCAQLGLGLHALAARDLPVDAARLRDFTHLCEREAVLAETAILVDCHAADAGESGQMVAVNRFARNLTGVILVANPGRLRLDDRLVVSVEVHKPTLLEQRRLWTQTLGDRATGLDETTRAITEQFDLGAVQIETAYLEAVARLPATATDPQASLAMAVWDACRIQVRPALEDVAQRITTVASWHDLVLPEAARETLDLIAGQVRQRRRVYDEWGYAAKTARGLGISVLFAGASGTGKTMAAEVLAHELRLDLYRIDLSATVSKYIGETEKNLRRIFDAAEAGGAILLFDEADALFGKRSQVKDSHDRYANIEVSYLLQRMEHYQGLAILTTNLEEDLDAAFLRRIRFIVRFPFPSVVERAEIWRRIFPESVPVEGLDPRKLAVLNVAGGHIHTIALNAAFLAADQAQPIRMTHVLRAARSEYEKLKKPLTEAETRGWI